MFVILLKENTIKTNPEVWYYFKHCELKLCCSFSVPRTVLYLP